MIVIDMISIGKFALFLVLTFVLWLVSLMARFGSDISAESEILAALICGAIVGAGFAWWHGLIVFAH